MTGFAQSGFIATQARDDLADRGDISAAQPKNVGTAGIPLRHGTLRDRRAAAQRESQQCGANDLVCSPADKFPRITVSKRVISQDQVVDEVQHRVALLERGQSEMACPFDGRINDPCGHRKQIQLQYAGICESYGYGYGYRLIEIVRAGKRKARSH